METTILPSQVFFNPNQKFLNWAKKNLKGHILIDCGAGTGRLTKALQDIKLNALGIDICDREEVEAVIIHEDSTTFDFPDRSIAIIARPSRGKWIRDTIYNALKTCSYVLYIGLGEHMDEDIDPIEDDESLILDTVFVDAGEDHEFVMKISKDKGVTTKMKTYYLVKRNAVKDIWFTTWQEDGDNKWLNFNGGWCPKNNSDKIIETQEAEDIHDLDWAKTNLIDNKNSNGWVDRSGKFYGCSSQSHDLVADLVFNKSVEKMENQGYIRIYDNDNWACRIRMSPEQRNYMLNRGFKLMEDD